MTEGCLVEGCTARIYAPSGSGALCKEHFIKYVTWRRRKGPGMFATYAKMTMTERNTLVAEWLKSLGLGMEPAKP